MSELAKDANGSPVQCMHPGATEKLTSTATASNAPAVADGVTVVRLVADANIHYSLIGTATDADVFMPAGQVEYISVSKGEVLSVVGEASVYVTAMS